MKTKNITSFKAIPKNVRVINKNLLAGGKLTFSDLKELKKEGLTQVIDLRSFNSIYQRTKEYIFCYLLNIKRKNIPIDFTYKLPPKSTFIKVKNIVNNNKPNKTIIHCNLGYHRTNLFCMGVQILNGEKNIKEAVDYVLANNYTTIKEKTARQKRLKAIKLNNLKLRLNEFINVFSGENKK